VQTDKPILCSLQIVIYCNVFCVRQISTKKWVLDPAKHSFHWTRSMLHTYCFYSANYLNVLISKFLFNLIRVITMLLNCFENLYSPDKNWQQKNLTKYLTNNWEDAKKDSQFMAIPKYRFKSLQFLYRRTNLLHFFAKIMITWQWELHKFTTVF